MKQKNFDSSNATILMLINDIAKIFHNNIRNISVKNNINASYRPLLFHLSRNDSLTQLDLVNLTHLTAPSISVTLQKMEMENLITRQVDSNDMRKFKISLTDKGREMDEQIRSSIKIQENLCLENISEKDLEITKQTLLSIKNNTLKAEQNYKTGRTD